MAGRRGAWLTKRASADGVLAVRGGVSKTVWHL